MKQKVIVVNGKVVAIFNQSTDVMVASADDDELTPIHEYMVTTLMSEMYYDAVQNQCDFHVEEREVKEEC